MALKDWSTTAANNVQATTGIAADEGQLAGTVNNGVRELMAQVKAMHLDNEWIRRGDSITFISPTQFQVNNVTDSALYGTNRRVKVIGTGTGTIFGTVTGVSVSAPNMTVTVSFDSGSMSNEALEVQTGILAATSQSVPTRFGSSTTFSNNVTIDGALNLAAASGLFRNVSIVSESTRSSVSGSSPLTIANVAYTKATAGQLLVVAMIGIYRPTSTSGPLYARYDTDSQQADNVALLPTFNSGERIVISHLITFASIAAGAQTLDVTFRRDDADSMAAVYNPNSTDIADLPASTASTFVFLEL